MGITGDYVEVGTELDLSCTISRIKPAAAKMYWTIGGQDISGSLSQTDNSDGTFSQSNMLQYK